MRQFGWAFLGCGGIAYTVAKELKKEKNCEIVSCWNRTPARAEAFAKKFGTTAYPTVEEAISAPGVDGVYIAVIASRHAELIRRCIERGVPVLCEKPFTVNTAEAEEVFSLARQKNTYLAEAMWTWYNAPALKIREWVKSGKIGTVKNVKATYAFPMLKFSKNPRLTTRELIGGALMDIGIYPVRYLYELFGMPKSISCKGNIVGGVDLSEEMVIDYGSFRAELTVSMEKMLGEELVIEGTKGKITSPYFHMAKKASLTGENKEKFVDKSLKYAVEFSRVAEEIGAELVESRYCPAQSTIDTMKLLDECRRQMGVIYPQEEKKS